MELTTHERPGVYSAYDASTVVSGSGGGKVAGLAALVTGETDGALVRVSRYEDAVAAFGEDEAITELIRLLLLNGAAAVAAVPVADTEGYDDAFAALEAVEDVQIMVCDSDTLTVQQAMRDSIKAASEARKERIGVVCGAKEETVSALVTRAQGLNSERIVVAAPGLDGENGAKVAAAVAGAIAGEIDPAVPLGGAELRGLGALAAQYSDSEIDQLVRGGVTPVESVAHRAKNTEQSRGAIRSQVILELENKVAREIITGYDGVTVSALEEDPTVCLVEFSFTVAHGLNQIWLSAHITV